MDYRQYFQILIIWKLSLVWLLAFLSFEFQCNLRIYNYSKLYLNSTRCKLYLSAFLKFDVVRDFCYTVLLFHIIKFGNSLQQNLFFFIYLTTPSISQTAR